MEITYHGIAPTNTKFDWLLGRTSSNQIFVERRMHGAPIHSRILLTKTGRCPCWETLGERMVLSSEILSHYIYGVMKYPRSVTIPLSLIKKFAENVVSKFDAHEFYITAEMVGIYLREYMEECQNNE